jgi:hypothetical protein
MALEKRKKKKTFMKKTVKFMAEGQKLKAYGASFMTKRVHKFFFFTKTIIEFLGVERGAYAPLQPPLPPPLAIAYTWIYTLFRVALGVD